MRSATSCAHPVCDPYKTNILLALSMMQPVTLFALTHEPFGSALQFLTKYLAQFLYSLV
jgi:hypothetical protein